MSNSADRICVDVDIFFSIFSLIFRRPRCLQFMSVFPPNFIFLYDRCLLGSSPMTYCCGFYSCHSLGLTAIFFMLGLDVENKLVAQELVIIFLFILSSLVFSLLWFTLWYLGEVAYLANNQLDLLKNFFIFLVF